MTIVHILWSAGLGGIQRLVLDLATEQSSNGHKVRIVVCKDGGEMKELFASGPWDYVSLSLRRAVTINPRAIRQLIDIAKDADILHLHDYTPNVDIATRFIRVPIVYTEHGLFASGRRITLKDRSIRIPKKWFLRNRVDSWVANSHYTKRRIGELYGKDNPVSVIYNGHLLSASILPVESAESSFCVACIGRLAGVKRFDWVLRAFASLPRKTTDTLLVVGEGDLKHELSNLADQLGLGPQVRFIGYSDNVQDLLSSVTIVTAPSVGEAFGLVALDAMAAAKPIIVTEDGGGLVELVSGILPQNVVRDERQLAERLASYQLDPQQARDDGQLFAGELDKYSMRRTAIAYERVYEAVGV